MGERFRRQAQAPQKAGKIVMGFAGIGRLAKPLPVGVRRGLQISLAIKGLRQLE